MIYAGFMLGVGYFLFLLMLHAGMFAMHVVTSKDEENKKR